MIVKVVTNVTVSIHGPAGVNALFRVAKELKLVQEVAKAIIVVRI